MEETNPTKITKKAPVGGQEAGNVTPPKTIEEIKEEFNAFIANIFSGQYREEDAKKAKISMQANPLSEIDYKKLEELNASLFGQYTMNPETAGMNYKEKEPKVKILDEEEVKQFVGKPRSEVMAYIVKTYGGQYYIPGLEYQKYLLENPDKVPAGLQNGNVYYFMGSTFRCLRGELEMPCMRQSGNKLDWNLALYGFHLHGRTGFILLER